jgi:hypothetical protein
MLCPSPTDSGSSARELSRERTEAIRRRLDRRVPDLRLFVTDSGLVLVGRAYSWYAKQLAQQVAVEMIGLPVSRNAIEVVPPRHLDDTPDEESPYVPGP